MSANMVLLIPGLEAVVRMANRAEKVLEVAQSAPGSVAGEAGQDAEETE